MMYRSGCGRSSMISSCRSKENSSSGSRCSRPGAVTSGSTRGRSPRRSRSPSPRGRRHRSPSSSRSSRRSPSPRRSSRRRSPGRRSRSPGRHSRSPGRRSPSRHSESSVEQNLRITVGNDRYGIDTPERKRLCDRLGSPVDSLSDADRDDLADGPIFSRSLLRPRSRERYSSREENQSSPFSMRHDEDYRNRDVFLHQTDYSMNYENKPREADRDGELLRKSLYALDDRGREPKRPRYDRDDRLLDMNTEPQGFLPGTRKYRKQSLSRSPSPTYLNEDFRELESARRKRKEEELSRNLSHELSGSSYVMTGSTNPMQSSEPRYLYRPDEAPAMPKKSILKKRVDDHSVQPEVFSSSSSTIKEPPLLSDHPLPQRSSVAPFSLEVENFLKQFNKNAIAESASKESQGSEHDWGPFSGLQQNTFPFEQNSENFLKQKEPHESTSESVDQHGDFLLPHERASQDGSGFSRILGILGVMADSTSTQEKRRRSFPDDIEDEEKFLYGDDDDDCNISSPSTQKLTVSDGKESVSQKVSSPPPLSSSIKPETSDESRPEYEKIHNLLKTIGLDIGVAEIGKLAARTQERLHGKKSSRSPDHYSVASSKPEMWERCRNRSETHCPESSQKHSHSPSGSFPSSKVMSSVTKSEHNPSKMLGHNNPADTVERSVPPISLIPSAPPSLPNLSPAPTSVSQYSVSRFSPFPATQLPQNYPSPTMPPPGYDAYGHYMAYAASGWPMYAQQADPGLTNVHGLVTLTVPPNPTRPNLRVIETVSTGKVTPDIRRDESVLVQIPTAAPYSKLLPQFSQPSLRGSKERISDEKNRASRKQKVIEEMEKLKNEQETRQKKLHYLRAELNRLSKQQGELLRKKRREKDGHKDPLLIEVNRLQENIVKEIAQLKMNADAAEKKQSELDKVAQILGINISEKSRKLSSESKDFSEKNTSENAKIQEKTSNPVKESKTDKPRGKSLKPMESSSQPPKQQLQGISIYDYYDTGNHWCKDCNTTCGTMFDFFTHMHNKKHRQTLDPYNRPWAAKIQIETKQEVTKRIDKIPVPAKGFQKDGVYQVHCEQPPPDVSLAYQQQKEDNSATTWHRRFAHCDFDTILRMKTEGMVRDFEISNHEKCQSKCVICIKGKATRPAIPKQRERQATKPLELIHADLCGPLQASVGGNKYVLCFIDDFSRYCVTYLMMEKSQTVDLLKAYVAMVTNKFNRIPQALQSDRGGEFISQTMQTYLTLLGIEHRLTTPYMPEQNGVAERKNRSLMDMVRCMLLEADLPDKYWADAVLTATYLKNRLPTKANKVTPFELWHERKPSIKHLRVFGSKAYPHIPKEKRSKLDSRVEEGIVIGYAPGSKGYRILNPKTGKVSTCRVVYFDEREKGYHSHADDDCAETNSGSYQLEMFSPTSEDTTTTSTQREIEAQAETPPESDEAEDAEGAEPTSATPEPAPRRSSQPNKGGPAERFTYLARSSLPKEPASWNEVLQMPSDEASKWKKAAQEELEALHKNKTWTLTKLPTGKKAIGCKWVFKAKQDENGEVQRYKARLVAKGYSQKYGLDYYECFAPVVKHTTIRMLLSLAASRNMSVEHLDGKTAFLHEEIEEELYMLQPPGFANPKTQQLVCKLQKGIYGLKQAVRAWDKKLNQVLLKQGFVQGKADPCLYTRHRNGREVYVLCYVDDLMICHNNKRDFDEIVSNLNKEVEVKHLGNASYYLGIQIEKEEDGSFLLSQKQKTLELLESLGLQNANPMPTPMKTDFHKQQEPSELLPENNDYKSAIGKLLYLAATTRPDIAAAVNVLCRKTSTPTQRDWIGIKRVGRYLKGTIHLKLKLPATDNPKLVGFTDADWAEDITDRKSTSGHVFFYGGGAVSWGSRKQDTVAHSSTEAEYVSAAETCKEVSWLKLLLEDMGIEESIPVQVYEDNQSCIRLLRSENISGRTKHIDVKYHAVKDLQEQGIVRLDYCPTRNMTADILTKPLPKSSYQELREKLNLVDSETQ